MADHIATRSMSLLRRICRMCSAACCRSDRTSVMNSMSFQSGDLLSSSYSRGSISRSPDHSRHIARNCAAVKVHFDDIDSFLVEVEGRLEQIPGYADARVDDLTAYGHLLAVDVPRLVALVRELKNLAEKAA